MRIFSLGLLLLMISFAAVACDSKVSNATSELKVIDSRFAGRSRGDGLLAVRPQPERP